MIRQTKTKRKQRASQHGNDHEHPCSLLVRLGWRCVASAADIEEKTREEKHGFVSTGLFVLRV